MDALAPGQHSKLTHKLAEQIEAAKVMNYGAVNKEVMVEGLVL